MQTVSGFQWTLVKHVTRAARIRTMGTLCARWIWKMNHCRYGRIYVRPYLRPYLLTTSLNSGIPDSKVLTNWKLNDSSFFIERFLFDVRKFAILTRLKKSPNSKPTSIAIHNLAPLPKTSKRTFSTPRDDSKFSRKPRANAMSFGELDLQSCLLCHWRQALLWTPKR